MRRLMGAAAAGAIAIVATFTMSQVAGAQYPPVVCVVTINPASVPAGGTATLSGSIATSDGPAAGGSPVSFSINGQDLGSTTTDDAGTFSLEVTIPDLPAGTYSIVANCGPGVDGDILGNTNVNVVPDGGGGNNNENNQGNQGGNNQGNQGGNNQGGSNLARTGTDLGLPVQVGVGLLALGGIALALSASKRRTSAA